MFPPTIKNPERTAKVATIAALAFLVGMGLIQVLLEIKPFWIDEWRIIYNLKTKTAAALWGPLDLMQQFPRTYLQIIKRFTQYFDYSYFSLRFPSFVIGTALLAFCYRLMQKIYPTKNATRYLFILILASSHTFSEYYVQIKQYTMDIFLGLVALWQLLQLLQLKEKKLRWQYLLLCISFLVAPFFSYSYSILFGPILAISALQSILYQPTTEQVRKSVFLTRLWFPLLLCLAGMGAFYIIDAAQLMKDNGMKTFWVSMMMTKGFEPLHFIRSFSLVFANLGNGALFEIIFGVTGVAAFGFGVREYLQNFTANTNNVNAQLRLYGISLVCLILLLFIAGKLPIGEPRLNSYSVPAIAILIIYLLDQFTSANRFGKAISVLVVVLFLGTIGNIINSPIKKLVSREQRKKLAIYNNVTAAIHAAERKNLPIFVTSGIAHPCEKIINWPLTSIRADILCYPDGYDTVLHFTSHDDLPADWVLKTMPAYKMSKHIPVYAIDSASKMADYINKIPGNATAAVVVEDTSYKIYEK